MNSASSSGPARITVWLAKLHGDTQEHLLLWATACLLYHLAKAAGLPLREAEDEADKALAAACLFLASKNEMNRDHCYSSTALVRDALEVAPGQETAWIVRICEAEADLVTRVFFPLCATLEQRLPYAALSAYAAHATEHEMTAAVGLLNDLMRLPQCLDYEPRVMAGAALYLARHVVLGQRPLPVPDSSWRSLLHVFQEHILPKQVPRFI